jgi:NADH-quinone oxidoreductase subunit J
MVETITFLVAAAIVLVGAGGVIVSRNPVHAALSLVASLFGVAVLFVAQDAHLLAAVQVIVYTGAIVVLILFVLMLLGVDRAERLDDEPIAGQRPLAILVGVLGLVAVATVLLLPVIDSDDDDATFEATVLTGQRSSTAPLVEFQGVEGSATGETELVATDTNVRQLGSVLFTEFVFAFEATALLLTIAVVGAVVMARRVRDAQPLPEPEPMGDVPADVEVSD